MICQNCDQPILLVNFGFRPTGLFNRCSNFVHACSKCRRSFRDDSIKDVPGWVALNLEAEVWPDCEMVWDRRVKL